MHFSLAYLLVFLVGLLLGHWLTIARDRRKEFNDVSQQIRAALIKDRENPSLNYAGPSAVEIDLFESLMPSWRRRGFRLAIERYQRSKKEAECQEQVYGTTFYGDTEAIKRSIDQVISFTERR